MKKRPPTDTTTPPVASGPRLRRKTLRVLTEAQLGAVNGAKQPTYTWTTAVWNGCPTFETALDC